MCPLKRSPLTIELALLGFFRHGPSYGYEIYQEMNQPQGLGLVWQIKQSHLYALLGRLEAAGFLGGTLETQETRPARILRSLTKTGMEAFMDWVATPVQQPRCFRMEFPAKLYFALQDSYATTLTLIDRQKDVCREWSERVKVEVTGKPHHPADYSDLVFLYRAEQIHAIERYLEVCRATVSESSNGEGTSDAGLLPVLEVDPHVEN